MRCDTVKLTVHIRWGNTTIPNISGTELLNDGIATESYNTHVEVGSNHQCLPKTQKYSNYYSGSQGMSLLHGTEYQQDHGSPLPT